MWPPLLSPPCGATLTADTCSPDTESDASNLRFRPPSVRPQCKAGDQNLYHTRPPQPVVLVLLPLGRDGRARRADRPLRRRAPAQGARTGECTLGRAAAARGGRGTSGGTSDRPPW